MFSSQWKHLRSADPLFNSSSCGYSSFFCQFLLQKDRINMQQRSASNKRPKIMTNKQPRPKWQRIGPDDQFDAHFEERISAWKKFKENEYRARTELNNARWMTPLRCQLVNKRTDIGGEYCEFFVDADALEERQKTLLAEIGDLWLTIHLSRNRSILTLEHRDLVQCQPTLGPGAKDVGSTFIGSVTETDRKGALTILISGSIDPYRLKQLHTHKKWNLKAIEHDNSVRLLDLLDVRNRNKLRGCPGFKLMLQVYKMKRFRDAKKADKVISDLQDMNKSQMETVVAALNAKSPVIAIQGSPGTGKTRVVAEIVCRVGFPVPPVVRDRLALKSARRIPNLKNNRKVLVCAQSHRAVQNVLQACKKNRDFGKYNYVHISTPNGMGEEQIDDGNIESRIRGHARFGLMNSFYELYEEMDRISDGEDKRSMHILHSIRSKGKVEEWIMQTNIVKQADVIFCTSGSKKALAFLEKGLFTPNIVVVDEAGQVLESDIWMMLLQAPQCVIVGDHQQLSPVVQSRENQTVSDGCFPTAAVGSLLEYLDENFDRKKGIFYTLKTQYRSNELIHRWSNEVFYNNELETSPLVRDASIKDLLKDNGRLLAIENEQHLITDPLVLVDTSIVDFAKWKEICELHGIGKCDFFEKKDGGSFSYHNSAEALCAALHLHSLLAMGVLNSEIGCITPYLAQAHLIRNFLGTSVDVSSVDAFQGQDREIIVMSFVRNNKQRDIGFLADLKRMNVAVTRAKRQFMLIGSSKMIKTNEKLSKLYEIVAKHGRICSPMELLVGIDALPHDVMAEIKKRNPVYRMNQI